MADAVGAHLAPGSLDRQDIARLTAFHKLLLEYETALLANEFHEGAPAPSISDIRIKYDHLVFEPMVQTWLSEPASAAGVIRFVLSELGAQFSGAEAQSHISASGFRSLLSQDFLDRLDALDVHELLTQDGLLEIFYETHVDELPESPGTPRAKRGVAAGGVGGSAPEPGSCADKYLQLSRTCALIVEHTAFRGLIGFLIFCVVVITGLQSYQELASGWLEAAEVVIVFVFFTEVVLKMVSHGLNPHHFFHLPTPTAAVPYAPSHHMQQLFRLRFWLKGVQGWNIFDMMVVGICVAQVSTSADSSGLSNDAAFICRLLLPDRP
eukprot:COSAG04_NODE_204_length_20429_cov_6.166896_10_plen_323_part_00